MCSKFEKTKPKETNRRSHGKYSCEQVAFKWCDFSLAVNVFVLALSALFTIFPVLWRTNFFILYFAFSSLFFGRCFSCVLYKKSIMVRSKEPSFTWMVILLYIYDESRVLLLIYVQDITVKKPSPIVALISAIFSEKTATKNKKKNWIVHGWPSQYVLEKVNFLIILKVKFIRHEKDISPSHVCVVSKGNRSLWYDKENTILF